MILSKKFEELIIKQLESFGPSMGVTHLVMYLATAKQVSKATFEMIGQWPKLDRLLISIEDDPAVKVSSPSTKKSSTTVNSMSCGISKLSFWNSTLVAENSVKEFPFSSTPVSVTDSPSSGGEVN